MPPVHRIAIGCVMALALLLNVPGRAASMDEPLRMSIPEQALGDALRDLARRADLQILFDPELVAGLQGVEIGALLSPRQVLARLLEGTNLEARESTAGVVVIRRAARPRIARSRPAAAPAVAQDEQGSALSEIIVTSQRRAERLQEVPISIQAYNRAAMEVRGVRIVDEIARLTPGITFNRGRNYNSESSEIAIRGIGSAAGAATTGVYIDDTPIQSRHLSFGTFNAYPSLFDMERVEVLRGPQGTLFGAGSEGGTVRFITPEPSLVNASLYGRAELFATERGAPGFEYGAAAGGPLSGGLAARISASYRREGGYVDRIDWHGGEPAAVDSNSAVTGTVRLAFKWAAGDALTVSPSLLYQRRHVNDTSAYWARVPGSADPTAGQFDRPLRNGNVLANPSTDAFFLWAVRLNWELENVRLISSTSYFDRDESAVTDYAAYNRAVLLGNPYPPAGVRAPTQWADVQRNWTQEFRLESVDTAARLSWTAGVFLQRARENTVENVFDPALVAQLQLPVYRGGYIYFQQPFRSTDTQVAAFGQADWRLTDAVKLTLGLRFTHARFEGEAFFAGPVVGVPVSSRGRFSENPVTPKLGLSYQINADDLLYATIAKGYRIGGANTAVGQFCYGGPDSALGSIGLSQVPPEYGADSVWSYELGAKTAFADRRVTLDASAYWIQWNDIQQTVPLTDCGFQFISNLGRAQSRGVDLQAHVKLGDHAELGASLGVTDAFYSKTVRLAPTALSLVQDGDHLAAAPWTAAVFAEGHRMLEDWDAYARLDFQYGARQSATVPNSNALNGGNPDWFAGVPAQSSTSLRLGARRGGWDVSLFVQNLFDTRPRLTVNQDVGLGAQGTPLLYVISWRPRTAGVTATYRY